MTTSKKAITAIYIISPGLMLAAITGTILGYIIQSYPGIPPTRVQQIVSLPALSGMVASLVIGPLTMRFNKKYLTIVIGGCSLAYFAIFSVVGAQGPFFMLIVAALIAGIPQCTAMTLASAMIGEFVGVAKSSNYISIQTAIMNGGGVLMNLVGGRIAAGNDGANWPMVYYLGAVIVPMLVAFAILMPKKPDGAGGANAAGGDVATAGSGDAAAAASDKLPPRLFAIAGLGLVFAMMMSAFMLFISIYVINEYKLGTSTDVGFINSLFTAVGLAGTLTYFFWAKLFKGYLVLVCYLLETIGMFAVAFLHESLLGAYIVAVLMGWGFNVSFPFIMGFIMRITSPRMAPVGMSFLMVGVSLGMTVAPTVLNFLGALIGPGTHNVMLMAAVIMVPCCVIGHFVYKLPKGAVG